ncbi:MAG: BatD family protein, partial [Gemmatimonadetes bacterium]|nr:BatD family protein [Gemmatimonadota bacterium]
LWPPPFLRWRDSLQVYPEGTDEKLDAVAGELGGTKTFRYLVVPDSAGVLPIPTVTYHFFDPGPSTYQSSTVAGLRIPVAAALSAVASRAEPPPLLLRRDGSLPWLVVHTLPWWAWGGIWAVLPIVYLVGKLPRRARRAVERGARLPPWLEAQHRLEQALAHLLREGTPDPADLARALREAGADAALAERVVAVRDRLGAERFSPRGGALPATLLEESRAVVATLEKLAHRGRGTALKVSVIAGLLLLAIPATSQQVPAERLYETGAYRAAMEGFSLRAVAAPEVVGNWYGLGAAAYKLGNDGVAVAAWTRAARLAPRDRSLARAMLLIPAPDPASAEWRGVLPFTSEECFLVAVALWLAAWGGVLVSGRWRGRWGVVAGGALCLVALAAWSAWEGRQSLGILTASTPLRVSPHGRAPGSRELPIGTAVRPEGRRAGWVLVHAASGEIGWVEGTDLAWVRE